MQLGSWWHAPAVSSIPDVVCASLCVCVCVHRSPASSIKEPGSMLDSAAQGPHPPSLPHTHKSSAVPVLQDLLGPAAAQADAAPPARSVRTLTPHMCPATHTPCRARSAVYAWLTYGAVPIQGCTVKPALLSARRMYLDKTDGFCVCLSVVCLTTGTQYQWPALTHYLHCYPRWPKTMRLWRLRCGTSSNKRSSRHRHLMPCPCPLASEPTRTAT